MENYKDAVNAVHHATADVVSKRWRTPVFQAGAFSAGNETLIELVQSCEALSAANGVMARQVLDDGRQGPRHAAL